MRNIFNTLTLNTHKLAIYYTLSVIITLCLLFIYSIQFNLFTNNIPPIETSSYTKIKWSSQTSSTCDSLPDFFQKIIDLTENSEFNYDLLRYPNGDYLTFGNTGMNDFDNEGFIMKFDSTGHIHWTKIIGVDAYCPPSNPGFTVDIFESLEDAVILGDSTAIISGQRILQTYGIDRGFIMKIDFDGNIIWSKEFNSNNISENQTLFGITKINDQEIFLSGTYGPFNSNRGFLLSIDQDGDSINQFSWGQGLHNSVNPISFKKGSSYYFLGSSSHISPFYNKTRGIVLFELDQNFTIISSKEIFSNISNITILPSIFNWIGTNELLYIPLYLGHNNSDPCSGMLLLDSSMNVKYSKSYRDTTLNITEVTNDLFLNKDGTITISMTDFYSYYFFDNGANPNESISYAKLDSMGNIIWHRVYGGTDRDPYAFIEPGPNGGIMIAGSSFSFNTEGSGLYLLRTDSSGYAGDCYEESYDLIVEDLPIIIEDVEIETDTFPYDLVNFFMPSRTIYPVARELCCTNYADAALQYVLPAYPCGDSVGIAISICNTGYVDLPANFPVTVYQSNPTLGNAQVVDYFLLENPLPPDSCFLFPRTILDTEEIFAVLGDPQMTSPYDLPCDFPLSPTIECDYYNNMRSATIPDTIEIVPFNDDYYLACPDEQYAINLIVPPYFSNPIWNEMWETDTLSVWVAGTYILEATTPCGEFFVDSVVVTEQYQHLEFEFSDTTLCQGDTLVIVSPLQANTSWTIYPGLVLSHECPNTQIGCISDTIYCNTPGQYLVEGRKTLGWLCGTKDTFNLTILSAIEQNFDNTLCAGSTITIQGQDYIANDTTLYFSFSGANGCDSTHIYNLHLADTFYTTINELACPGDTIWHEGHPIATGETQNFYFQSAIGCDSTVTIQVGLLDTYQTEQQQTICHGDSILIFNQWQSQPGFYEQYYTAINGCDSLHIIDLLVYPELNINSEIQASCPDEATGQIDIQILSGAVPFNFEWSNGMSADSNLQQATSGNYTLTITDVNACSQVFDFSIPVHTESSYAGACTPQWYAPTAFSPNGDGINDRFTFYGNERAIRIEQLQIWDRWGNQVFEANEIVFNDEALGWDGLLKGKVMRSAVFVWKARVLLEGGVVEVAYGDLLLMR